MHKSNGTVRSSIAQQQQSVTTKQKQQKTTTSFHTTGGQSSSGQTPTANKLIDKQRPKIIEDNIDLTPKPLFDGDVGVRTRHGSALFHSLEGTSTPTDLLSNASILNTNIMLTGAQQSIGAFPENSTQLSNDSNQQPTESMQEMLEKDREMSALFITDIERKKKTNESEEVINLNETATFVLLHIPTTCVSNEDHLCEEVKENNKKYIELCKNKAGNDSYAERGINTFNDQPKIKSTQTERITINENGTNCTTWDMYDSYQELNKTEEEKKESLASESKNKDSSGSYTNSSVIDPTASQKMKSSYADTATESYIKVISETSAVNINNNVETVEKHPEDDPNAYLHNENFKLNAFFMERLLNQNTYQQKQARYRGLSPLDEALKEKPKVSMQQYDGLSLEKLWTYSCPLTKDRNISSISWNMRNQDILAVAYGKFEYNDDLSGLVCCWSLKNPEFPERFYKTEAGVTSLAFSQKHANLLAVGLFNGIILVYDVRKNNSEPLLTTHESEHKHLCPVWHLKWTDRERANSNGEHDDEMEVLMSISSDGRVTQWMIRKGFESLDYIKLKRVTEKDGEKKKTKTDGLISRSSGGLCFDINSQDKSIYLCGTEEGYIHRCSTSYNEQYLDTYKGHTGPVYKISWSPFLKDCFLSASSDWTVRLWKANRNLPCLTFKSSTKSVYDICWSNKSATLFCCVNENSIELWDLAKNFLDPIYVTNAGANKKLTAISYSPNSDCLVVGSSDGSIWVYAIKNLPQPTKSSALDEIIKQSLISQLESVKEDDDDGSDTVQQHQLQSLSSEQQKQHEEDMRQRQKEKLDAFEAKLDKIKSENAKILDGQSTLKLEKSKKKKRGPNASSDDSDSSDAE